MLGLTHICTSVASLLYFTGPLGGAKALFSHSALCLVGFSSGLFWYILLLSHLGSVLIQHTFVQRSKWKWNYFFKLYCKLQMLHYFLMLENEIKY